MNLFTKNILRKFSYELRKAVLWLTINSIIFISLLNIEQEISTSSSEKQNDTFITFTVQNILDQNYNQRNFRYRNSEKFSINEIITTVPSQDPTEPNSCQTILLIKSFGSVFISSQNNHSLRSPPRFS